MANKVKCWRCETLGEEGKACQGCGLEVSEYAPGFNRKEGASSSYGDPEKDALIDRLKPAPSRPSATNKPAGSSAPEELVLLQKIQRNTFETAAYLSALLLSMFFAGFGGFITWGLFTLAYFPVANCGYSDPSYCEPSTFFLVPAYIMAVATTVATLVCLATPFSNALEMRRKITS